MLQANAKSALRSAATLCHHAESSSQQQLAAIDLAMQHAASCQLQQLVMTSNLGTSQELTPEHRATPTSAMLWGIRHSSTDPNYIPGKFACCAKPFQVPLIPVSAGMFTVIPTWNNGAALTPKSNRESFKCLNHLAHRPDSSPTPSTSYSLHPCPAY